MKQTGYGKPYRYTHHEPHAAGKNRFPDGVQAQAWYEPTDPGMELNIAEKLKWLRSLEAEARDQGD